LYAIVNGKSVAMPHGELRIDLLQAKVVVEFER
jgi:hypothetical protein